MVSKTLALLLFIQSIYCLNEKSPSKVELNKENVLRHLNVNQVKEGNVSPKILAASSPIKCYSYIDGFSNLADRSQSKVSCNGNDNCVKYTETVNSASGTYEGCSSEFLNILYPNMGSHYYVPNNCSYVSTNDIAGNSISGTLCGCNNEDYCNSSTKTTMISGAFIMGMIYMIKGILNL
uniref:Plasmodium vivax Vir protein n=1 Tax=Parastrongyloides trichosuri TaxID=131310 RepID=A0A0N4ZJ44_PARTI